MFKFFKFIREAIGTILDIKDLLSLAIGTGGNVAAIIAFLNGLSIIWVWVIVGVSFTIFVIAIVRIFLGYRKWKIVMTTKQVIIEDINKLLFDMHQYLKTEGASLFEIKPTKKQFKRFSRSVLKSLQISEQKLGIEVNKSNAEKFLKKRLKKVYKISDRDYTSISEFLLDIAKALDKEELGLKHIRECQLYKDKYTRLTELELELPANITMPNLDLLERVYQLSYGLQSMGLFMCLSANRYQSNLPDKYIKDKDLFMNNLDLMYKKALFQVKKAILKSFIGEL